MPRNEQCGMRALLSDDNSGACYMRQGSAISGIHRVRVLFENISVMLSFLASVLFERSWQGQKHCSGWK